jgi:transposase
VIKVHPSEHVPARWIGVDLNTTGHAAVAAEPESGKVLKLGKNVHYVRSSSIKNCTKLYKEGKLWKLKKDKSRERKAFKAALNKISRQIVSFAESLGSGIKFEKLFSSRYSHAHDAAGFIEFSFGNGSFFRSSDWLRKWQCGGESRLSMLTRLIPQNGAVGAGISAGEAGNISNARIAVLLRMPI